MTDTFNDPVCGMQVTPQSAAGSTVYQGNTYYFCSLGCKNAFDAAPQKHLNKVGAHSQGCC